jgi:hypothetical protein
MWPSLAWKLKLWGGCFSKPLSFWPPFSIFWSGLDPSNQILHRRSKSVHILHVDRVNKDRYQALLKFELIHVPPLSHPILASWIDNQIELTTRAIVKSATLSKLTKTSETKSKSMPWWSLRLCALLFKARQAFKAWSYNKTPQLRQNFRHCAAQAC